MKQDNIISFFVMTAYSVFFVIFFTACGKKTLSRVQSIEANFRQLGYPERVYIDGKFQFAVFKWDKEKNRYGRMLCKNSTTNQENFFSSPNNCDSIQWVREANVLSFANDYIIQTNRQSTDISESASRLTVSRPKRAQELTEYVEQFKPLIPFKSADQSLNAEFEAEVTPALNELLEISEGIDFAEKFIKKFGWDEELLTFIRDQNEKLVGSSLNDSHARNSVEMFTKVMDELKDKMSTKLPFEVDSIALRKQNETIRPALHLLNMVFQHEKDEHKNFASKEGLTLKDVLKHGNLLLTTGSHIPAGTSAELNIEWEDSNGMPAPANEMLPNSISTITSYAFFEGNLVSYEKALRPLNYPQLNKPSCLAFYSNVPNDPRILPAQATGLPSDEEGRPILNLINPDQVLLQEQRLGPLLFEKIAIQGSINYSTRSTPVHKIYYSSTRINQSFLYVFCSYLNGHVGASLAGKNPLFTEFQKLLTEKKFLKSPAGKLSSIFSPRKGNVLFDSVKMDPNGW